MRIDPRIEHGLSVYMAMRVAIATLLVCVMASAQEEPAPSRGIRKAEPPSENAPAKYASRHALVIGIDEYADAGYPDLGYAVADARAVAKILVERYAFSQENVRLRLNRDATRAAIERDLDEWAADPDRVDVEDLLVVFFAGHGVTRDLGSRGTRGYLVPSDGERDDKNRPSWSTLIGMPRLEQMSEAVPAKHALFVLDCCFGGLAVKRSAPPVAAGLTTRARQVMTAGNADQSVHDTGGGGHSVFTGALLAGLRGDADLDGDGAVTFGEIFNHVGREVERKTEGAQTPLQATFPDHDGGCVALFPPGLEPGQQTAHERLRSLRLTLEEELEERRRFSDTILIELLAREADDDLWPGITTDDAAYAQWLTRADEVVDRLALHKEALNRVRQEAYLKQVLAGVVEEGEGTEPIWEQADIDSRFRFQTFRQLVHDIEEKLVPAVSGVRSRRERASRLWKATIEDTEEAWDAAIASIGSVDACPLYAGLALSPQLGLIPLGRDPGSGLWEFGVWDQTGEIPVRGEDGRLILDDRSGIVLVLIPGGEFRMGSPPDERGRMSDEVPHEMKLDPFFLSKFEMTQAQWQAFTGTNPSIYGPPRYDPNWDRLPADRKRMWRHPVERVDWHLATRVLSRLGLQLPTEAQWEYAARGGTTTAWWTGTRPAGLAGAANLLDQFAKRLGAPPSWGVPEDFDDGFLAHAPVGSFRANAFGLHDVAGNVWEWCTDPYVDYATATNPGDGRRLATGLPHTRICRGGSFLNPASDARSANRANPSPDYVNHDLGLRPARPVRRP